MQKNPLKRTRISFWPQTRNLNVASYRIRCAQVIDALREAGLHVGIYSDKIRRYFQFLPFMSAPDILILSKRTRLTSLARAVGLKKKYGTKLVLDLSDNIYFESEKDKAGTRKKREKLPFYVNHFDMVVTPSPYLESELRQHIRHDMLFRVIPDAVENEPAPLMNAKDHQAAQQALEKLQREIDENSITAGRRLVWFGVSGTAAARNGMYDLEAYCDILEKHNANTPLSLTIISDDEARYRDLFSKVSFKTYYLDWNFVTFNPALKLHDIAVLPIRTNRYTMSKSANRITTAFANNLAVCASLIPSYEPFVNAAVFDDWHGGLEQLMAQNEERQARIKKAQETIARQYSLPAIVDEWRKVFDSLTPN